MKYGARYRRSGRLLAALAFTAAQLLPAPAATAAAVDVGGVIGVLDYDGPEVRALPRYCHYTQGFRDSVTGANDPVEVKAWYAKLGETFHHMHHWCWGLIAYNRALFGGLQKYHRDRNLRATVGEVDYVMRSAGRNHPLTPEFLTKRGDSQLRLGNAQGLQDLMTALDIKPDYWPPAVAMSDYYKRIGNTKMAREVLEKALKHSPDSKTLRQRLSELGAGKDKPAPEAQATRKSPDRKAADGADSEAKQ